MEIQNFYKLIQKLDVCNNDIIDPNIPPVVIAAFEHLPDEDKLLIITNGMNHINQCEVEKVLSDKTGIEDRRHYERRNSEHTVEELNKIELIKLKSWLVKTITASILMSMVCFVVVLAIFHKEAGGFSFNNFILDIIKITKLVFSTGN